MSEFKSEHNLDFYAAPFWIPGNICFKIGTCEGLYTTTRKTYDIIAVKNNCKNNGHFRDVLQFFENSCKRDRKDLRIVALFNKRLMKHLTDKCGFVPIDDDNVIKHYKKMK